ncbi:SDR family NAD(P)-dependent oxidoreductase [Ectothiorhodospiraceae bacterium WFHF3C12]|nr:SDR family NAD(P)-dependent oxidoreductase [Ectothiorhodospiraceae bacterium WFHF3C12]
MTDHAIVTGAGTGLGRAMALKLSAAGCHVIGVGRRVEPLESLEDEAPGAVTTVSADVGLPEGRQAVADAVPADGQLRYLIHNAGVLEPVGPLSDVSLKDWHYSQAINVEAPLFLTQLLLPRLIGGRVLHISSGAAHRSIPGWGAYCTSKAALHMLYMVLRDELAEHGVAVGSLRPGVVDTPMQALIREQPEDRFPAVERFRELKSSGALHDPDAVAGFAVHLLTEVDAERFVEEEWEYDQHRR